MRLRERAVTTSLVVIALIAGGPLAHATENSVRSEIRVVGLTSPGMTVTLSGLNLGQVSAVEVDSKPAKFGLLNDGSLNLQIPLTVQPGDVSLKLTGDFGTAEFSNLFEVMPLALEMQPKVTIGTFQGYVAVYTKNFKGFSMRIKIGDRERVIPVLGDNFTRNLTKVRPGRAHNVEVFLNDTLYKTGQLAVR